MDLKGYFKRIGFSGLYDKADLDTLCTIHKLHVMTIPFENLSLHCGEKNTIDLKVIYEKIVCDHRGGWCCESNLLFSWVLKEMGYTFTTLGAKVFSMIIAGKDQAQPPGVFRLVNEGDMWILEKTGRKPLVQNEAFAKSSLVDKFGTQPVFSFSLTPRAADHFLETSEYLQTSPESVFTQKSICSLQTANGFRSLIGWTYSEVTFNPEEDRDIYEMRDIPDSEIEAVLKDRFNLTLATQLTVILPLLFVLGSM
uniref:arylamine N-acetyltransferase n=1 Tax=Astyanax mexicanus TaxID=7994 RepID=A0A8B9HS11_ASTMX